MTAKSFGSYSSLDSVGRGRLELPTSRLSGVRSNHLSYRPEGMHTRSEANRIHSAPNRVRVRLFRDQSASRTERLGPSKLNPMTTLFAQLRVK